MAYGTSSNGGELLSDRNISPYYVLPFVHDCEWSSGTVGMIKTVVELEGMSEGGVTYPSPVLSVGLFMIDSIWVSFSLVSLSN
jgi:hypothetical protein